MRKLNVKHILLSLLALIVVATGGYKYYEWKTLNTLVNQYNTTWKEELTLTETFLESANEFYSMLNASEEETATIETEGVQNKLLGQTNLLIDQSKQYQEILRNNKKTYEQMNSQSNFLLDNNKQFSQDLIALQVTHYKQETESTERGLAALYFFHNMFTLGEDATVLDEGDPSYYGDNIDQLASLKKYTNETYTFSHQDEIKKYYPKANDYLQKHKAFFNTYYEIAEDFARDDQESAAYKAARLQEDALELNIDPSDLIDDEKEKERIKQSLTTIVKQVALIKKFEKQEIQEYPLLPVVPVYEDDLVLCQLYGSKALNLYDKILTDYPEAKNTKDLLRELNKISPNTSSLDKEFDQTVLNYTNTDEKISFVCTDTNKKKYTFGVVKYETE